MIKLADVLLSDDTVMISDTNLNEMKKTIFNKHIQNGAYERGKIFYVSDKEFEEYKEYKKEKDDNWDLK